MKKKVDVKSLNEYIDNQLENNPVANKNNHIKKDRIISWLIDNLIKMDFIDSSRTADKIYNGVLKSYFKSSQKGLNKDGDFELDDEDLTRAAGGVNLFKEDLDENN